MSIHTQTLSPPHTYLKNFSALYGWISQSNILLAATRLSSSSRCILLEPFFELRVLDFCDRDDSLGELWALADALSFLVTSLWRRRLAGGPSGGSEVSSSPTDLDLDLTDSPSPSFSVGGRATFFFSSSVRIDAFFRFFRFPISKSAFSKANTIESDNSPFPVASFVSSRSAVSFPEGELFRASWVAL